MQKKLEWRQARLEKKFREGARRVAIEGGALGLGLKIGLGGEVRAPGAGREMDEQTVGEINKIVAEIIQKDREEKDGRKQREMKVPRSFDASRFGVKDSSAACALPIKKVFKKAVVETEEEESSEGGGEEGEEVKAVEEEVLERIEKQRGGGDRTRKRGRESDVRAENRLQERGEGTLVHIVQGDSVLRGAATASLGEEFWDEDGEWVMCGEDTCKRWHRVPAHVDVKKLPKMWYCHMNTWGGGGEEVCRGEEKEEVVSVGAAEALQISERGRKKRKIDVGVWVQCNGCDAWHMLPPEMSSEDLGENFYCAMNSWEWGIVGCGVKRAVVSPEKKKVRVKKEEEEGGGLWRSVTKSVVADSAARWPTLGQTYTVSRRLGKGQIALSSCCVEKVSRRQGTIVLGWVEGGGGVRVKVDEFWKMVVAPSAVCAEEGGRREEEGRGKRARKRKVFE